MAGFVGQHAIVTGGSSGIGKATAVQLARAGADVSIIARGLGRIEKARDEIAAARIRPDQRTCGIAADVTDSRQVGSAIAAAIDHVGPPDLVITSAGMGHCADFRDIPLAVFERAMATNYLGTLYAIHAVLPIMERRKRGHLVLISSGAGLIGIWGYTAYGPTKFAIRGLGESLRAELRPRGIHVSVVYPPDTDTPQLEEENRTKPPETRCIGGLAKTWTADAVAREIVCGIQRRRFAITPGPEMTLLARLHSILAPGLHWYFDRLASRGRS